MFTAHMEIVIDPRAPGGAEYFSVPFQEGALRRLKHVLAQRSSGDHSASTTAVHFGRSLDIMHLHDSGKPIARLSSSGDGPHPDEGRLVALVRINGVELNRDRRLTILIVHGGIVSDSC